MLCETSRDLRAEMSARVASGKIRDLPRGKIGATQGRLHQVWKSDELRYLCLGYLFSPPGSEIKPMRSADLTPPMWQALFDWIGDMEVNGQWLPAPWFIPQAKMIKDAVMSLVPGMVESAIQQGGVVTEIQPAPTQITAKRKYPQIRKDYLG